MDTDKSHLNEEITHLVKQTLAQFLEVREREGAQLKVLIEERCIKCKVLLSWQVVVCRSLAADRNKLKDRITELVAQPDFDRLEQELVFLAQNWILPKNWTDWILILLKCYVYLKKKTL